MKIHPLHGDHLSATALFPHYRLCIVGKIANAVSSNTLHTSLSRVERALKHQVEKYRLYPLIQVVSI